MSGHAERPRWLRIEERRELQCARRVRCLAATHERRARQLHHPSLCRRMPAARACEPERDRVQGAGARARGLVLVPHVGRAQRLHLLGGGLCGRALLRAEGMARRRSRVLVQAPPVQPDRARLLLFARRLHARPRGVFGGCLLRLSQRRRVLLPHTTLLRRRDARVFLLRRVGRLRPTRPRRQLLAPLAVTSSRQGSPRTRRVVGVVLRYSALLVKVLRCNTTSPSPSTGTTPSAASRRREPSRWTATLLS